MPSANLWTQFWHPRLKANSPPHVIHNRQIFLLSQSSTKLWQWDRYTYCKTLTVISDIVSYAIHFFRAKATYIDRKANIHHPNLHFDECYRTSFIFIIELSINNRTSLKEGMNINFYMIKVKRFGFYKFVRPGCHQKSRSLRTVAVVSKTNLTEKSQSTKVALKVKIQRYRIGGYPI